MAFTGVALALTNTIQLSTISRQRMSPDTNKRSVNRPRGFIFQITGLSLENFQSRHVTGSAILKKFRISG